MKVLSSITVYLKLRKVAGRCSNSDMESSPIACKTSDGFYDLDHNLSTFSVFEHLNLVAFPLWSAISFLQIEILT